MLFKKSWLQELLWDEIESGEVVVDEITDTSRWSIHHRLVFKFQNKLYSTLYSTGATEQQCESPFEYDPDLIECVEVEPISRAHIVYEKVA